MNQFLKKAKELSKRSGCLKLQIGAVLVLGDKIIGEGWNDASPLKPFCPRETAPTGTKYFYCHTHCGQAFHAETMAIYKRKIDICEGSEMYIYGHKVCCPDCMEAMKQYGVKMVTLEDQEGLLHTIWIGN